eukprot:TRINITY_DN13155_c0_g1_i1.p1 TRINITY_DN13155_c0_g1~~TRINITY_DN13155_c0_g1_i1.p1  ORF type:complete len:1089 (+),score=152.80 TRINITY_DN13155_c0_g1_i1:38-3304(+)
MASMLIVRRSACGVLRPSHSRKQTLQQRWISNRLRSEEQSVVAEERMQLMGAQSDVGMSGTSMTAEQFLQTRKMHLESPYSIFQTKDIKSRLEEVGDFISSFISRVKPSDIDAVWLSKFLMSMYQCIRRHNIEHSAPRLLIQCVKTFKSHGFTIGTPVYNALMMVMYQERYDVQALYGIYNKIKEDGLRPNHQSFSIMFCISLRKLRKQNTEKFFDLCLKYIESPDVSYTMKVEVINGLLLGISEMANAKYATELMAFIRKCHVSEGHPPVSIPLRLDERKSKHLYIATEVSSTIISYCSRIRSVQILECIEPWVNDLAKLDCSKETLTRLNCYLMHSMSVNNEVLRAFDLWDEIKDKFPDTLRYNKEAKRSCQILLEYAARARGLPSVMERYEQVLADLKEFKIIDSRDSYDLHILQLRLFVAAGAYDKVTALYHQLKRQPNFDNRFMRIICSGPTAKNYLVEIRNIYLDMKELSDSQGVKENSRLNMMDSTEKYLGLLADAGEFSEVLEVMKDLKEDNKGITLDIVHKALLACARDKGASSYGTFYKWGEGGQDDMPLYFSHMKNRQTTKKNCDVAQHIFDQLKELNLSPTIETYNRLISVYSEAGMAEEVQRLVKEVESQKDISPDGYTYYYSAKSWATKGQVDMVDAVIENLFETDSNKFTPHFVAQAIRALGNMGMKVETVAYIRTISDDDEGPDWLDDQPCKIITVKQPRPMEVKAGFRLKEMLTKTGVNPTLNVYTALLGLCTRAGDHEAAERVYEELKEEDPEGIYDRTDVVTSLMKMHYTTGRMDNALALLEDVRANEGGRLDITAYHNCISTCAAHGCVSSARHVLSTMMEDDTVKVTDTAIGLAIIACANSNGDDGVNGLTHARSILEDYRKVHKTLMSKVPAVDTRHVFHKMLYCCAKEQDSEAANSYLEEMRSLGMDLDSITMGYLAQTIKDPTELDQFWGIMEREKITPDAGILYSLLRVCERNRQYMAALGVITRYPQACTEKLQFFFFQILQKSKATTIEKQKCDEQLQTYFGKSLTDLASAVNKLVKEAASEATATEADVEQDAQTYFESESDDTEGLIFDSGEEDSGVSF